MLYQILILLLLYNVPIHSQDIIIDSNLTIKESLAGKNIPDKIKNKLVLIDVQYFSFDNLMHKGQLLIDKTLTDEVLKIFETIKKEKFPLGRVIPISEYNWDDSLSMCENNTSAFNYRAVKGTRKLSAHSNGRAIDINPLLNPQFKRGNIYPPAGNYNKEIQGTLHQNSLIVKEFKKYGWKWGGNWKSTKDYMHFEK